MTQTVFLSLSEEPHARKELKKWLKTSSSSCLIMLLATLIVKLLLIQIYEQVAKDSPLPIEPINPKDSAHDLQREFINLSFA
jgi:hypothetical protein